VARLASRTPVAVAAARPIVSIEFDDLHIN
jgi:hypothetical protein